MDEKVITMTEKLVRTRNELQDNKMNRNKVVQHKRKKVKEVQIQRQKNVQMYKGSLKFYSRRWLEWSQQHIIFNRDIVEIRQRWSGGQS